MEETTTTTTETASEAAATAAPETTAETTEKPTGGETLLGGDDAPKAEGEATTDGAAPKEEPAKKSGSLLDDEPKAEEPKKPDEGAEPKAPTDEEVAAWVKGVPALDLGDGVKWDDAALKAMAPSLMGLKREESNKVIGAYAKYTQELARRQVEAAEAYNKGLIQECNKRFGTDLKKIVGYAKKGGAAIFGDKIWNEMKTVPSFANNPDVMERLAEYGRKIATDSGKVTPTNGGTPDDGDVLHRMYGGVKI